MSAPRNPGDGDRGQKQQGDNPTQPDKVQQGGTPGGSGTTDRDHGGQASHQKDQGRGGGNQATTIRPNGSGTERSDGD